MGKCTRLDFSAQVIGGWLNKSCRTHLFAVTLRCAIITIIIIVITITIITITIIITIIICSWWHCRVQSLGEHGYKHYYATKLGPMSQIYNIYETLVSLGFNLHVLGIVCPPVTNLAEGWSYGFNSLVRFGQLPTKANWLIYCIRNKENKENRNKGI